MSKIDQSLRDRTAVLQYLKGRYQLYHQSNVFLRDIQYGLQHFLGERGTAVSYGEAEEAARRFAAALEREGVFLRVDQQTWTLNYPPFKKPMVKAPEPAVKPAAAPKPGASPAPAQPKPAAPKPPAAAQPGNGSVAPKPAAPAAPAVPKEALEQGSAGEAAKEAESAKPAPASDTSKGA